MDEIQLITQIISTMGFPIVACIMMWRYINTTQKELGDMVSKNTAMLDKMCDKLDLFMCKDRGDM